jgi:hypothetical protein
VGLLQRLDRLVRPPGHVPLGGPRRQRHLARWWRLYGVAALGLLVAAVISAFFGTTGPSFLGPPAGILGFEALWGWRVTHPPG